MATKKSGTPAKRTAKPTASKNYRSADAAAGAASTKARAKAQATGQSKESSMDAVTRRYKTGSFDEGFETNKGSSYYKENTGKDRMTGRTKYKIYSQTTDRSVPAKTRTNTSYGSWASDDAKTRAAENRAKKRQVASTAAMKKAQKRVGRI
jgi:hypothetical protein